MAAHNPDWRVDLADISDEALSLARENIAFQDVADRVRAIKSDLFAGLKGEVYDLIVTNPPYVTEQEFAALPPEYSHEPELGLTAGEDGLDFALRILDEAPRHLSEDGWLICEVGEGEQAWRTAAEAAAELDRVRGRADGRVCDCARGYRQAREGDQGGVGEAKIMSSNSFGKLFTVTTFGESHGPAIGCVIDGCPPGLDIAPDEFRRDLDAPRHRQLAATPRSGTRRMKSRFFPACSKAARPARRSRC